jgi:hypothetical protein
MNKKLAIADQKNVDDEEFGPEYPQVPRPVDGYVIYTQVAIDLGNQYRLGLSRQSALNQAMTEAIKGGVLRTYDVHRGLPSKRGEISPYVRPDEVNAWLEAVRYPLKWGQGSAVRAEERNSGVGTLKSWDDTKIQRLIKRRQELHSQRVKNWATAAAAEFDISSRRANDLISEFDERKRKRQDPSTWGK